MSLKARLAAYDSTLSDQFTVATRVYLHDKAHCTAINDDVFFRLRDSLSRSLSVPFGAVVLAGSGQIGWSVKRELPFNSRDSDLDFAVIDSICFQLALEDAVASTRGFTDQTLFDSAEKRDAFRDYTARGILRPDLMPRCSTKTTWSTITNELSRDGQPIASSASFAVYLSESLFLGKQKAALNVVRRKHP